MKKLLISVIAAATLLTAAPAMAQGFDVRVPGVDIRVGPDRDRYYRDHWDHGYYSYGWRRDRCRTVTVRERLWDGTVVVRTRERC